MAEEEKQTRMKNKIAEEFAGGEREASTGKGFHAVQESGEDRRPPTG